MATQIAVSKAIRATGATRVITFHSRIQQAADFASDTPRGIGQYLDGFIVDHVSGAQRVADVQMEPPRTAVLRPENELRPEISLTWRIFHADQYLKAVSEADRGRLTALEKRLVAMGLKHGHW